MDPAGSWSPCARLRAATEADAEQLRRTIDFRRSNSSGWPPASPQWEGGGSWELCCPPLAASTARVGRRVPSFWLQVGALVGISIVSLWRFMEKLTNIRLWSRTQVSSLPYVEDSGRWFGWSRMIPFPLWFPFVAQPWAWPRRKSQGEACVAFWLHPFFFREKERDWHFLWHLTQRGKAKING